MSEISTALSANAGTLAVPPTIDGRHRARRVVVTLLRGYQVARSGHPSPCRFTPTCSHYAVEAVTLHGIRRGALLTGRRLVRCRPGGPFGYDPVPPADPSCPVFDCPPVPE